MHTPPMDKRQEIVFVITVTLSLVLEDLKSLWVGTIHREMGVTDEFYEHD